MFGARSGGIIGRHDCAFEESMSKGKQKIRLKYIRKHGAERQWGGGTIVFPWMLHCEDGLMEWMVNNHITKNSVQILTSLNVESAREE